MWHPLESTLVVFLGLITVSFAHLRDRECKEKAAWFARGFLKVKLRKL
jgi:hypothetical protein